LYWDDPGKICKFKHEAVCGPVAAPLKVEEHLEPENRAGGCNITTCVLPFCYCSSNGEAGPVPPPGKPPQFVLLTIDGAVNSNNFDYYQSLLNTSEKLRATFFIEHEYCDYYSVERLYSAGNEIALSSVTGKSLQNANASDWRRELLSLRGILEKFANVHQEDIVGVRAPNLKPGYNSQFDVLVESGFIYDSSIATPTLKTPVFPYTLDYKIPHPCKFESCPTKAYPGLWEIPVNSHQVEDQTGGQCSYLDQCVFSHQSSDDVFAWLKEDFSRHYEGNRAPYMVSTHTNWFLAEHQFDGLKKFISWSKDSFKDVYFVTVTELLLWMTEPISDKVASAPLELSRKPPCNTPNSCQLSHEEANGDKSVRYMRTCSSCPLSYPWLSDLTKE
jgi:hypothetical protein